MSDNPYPLPSPGIVALTCLSLAWRDDIDDEVRKSLEHAHDSIVALMDRLVTQAAILERLEAQHDA
jgi:hypothetical protein